MALFESIPYGIENMSPSAKLGYLPAIKEVVDFYLMKHKYTYALEWAKMYKAQSRCGYKRLIAFFGPKLISMLI